MILWYQYKKQNWAVFPSPINPSYLIMGPPSSTKFLLFIDAKSRFNDTKFAYRNPTSLVPILRKSTCKFFLSFSCLFFVYFLSLFVCSHFFVCVFLCCFVLFFVLLKLMVLQHTLFTKAHNMLRFLIETLRELSVIRLMTTRFQTIFANALSVVAGGNIIPEVELK